MAKIMTASVSSIFCGVPVLWVRVIMVCGEVYDEGGRTPSDPAAHVRYLSILMRGKRSCVNPTVIHVGFSARI
jgi:hypothetical protein